MQIGTLYPEFLVTAAVVYCCNNKNNKIKSIIIIIIIIIVLAVTHSISVRIRQNQSNRYIIILFIIMWSFARYIIIVCNRHFRLMRLYYKKRGEYNKFEPSV